MKANPFDHPTLMGSGAPYQEGMKILGGRFVLERQLGRGGMGEVWLARDTELGDQRALKFLPNEVAHDPKALSQLRREAAAGQRLSHPRIVKTHDLHVGDGHAAVAMEYVDGKTLNGLQAEIEKGYFEVSEIAGWIQDVCEALDYAHGEAKVVHRDLKPSNIIIEKSTGRAKVLDFGISRRIAETHTQITGKDSSGTMAYSSPQQINADRGLPADDLYALGATLYELLTGTPPFFRSLDLRWQILEKIPPSMTERRAELVEEGMVLGGGQAIPPNWEQGIASCLSKEAAKRPANAMTLWRGLSGETVRQEERNLREAQRQSAAARSPSVPSFTSFSSVRAQKTGTRKGAGVWVVLGLLAVAAVVGGILWSGNSRNEDQTVSDTDVKPRGATKDQPFVNSLGMKFVPVPITGEPSAGQKVLFSIWETRVGDFAAFVEARQGSYRYEDGSVPYVWTGETWGPKAGASWKNPGFGQTDAHPVTCVSWEDAGKFCAWLTEQERASGKIGRQDTYRLPTDHEWSCAIGIGDREVASKTPGDKSMEIADVYPWGTSWPPQGRAGNYCGQETTGKFGSMIDGYEDGYMTTAPVESFDKNDKGLYDLGGNVWEWCESSYDGSSAASAPRVLRGGSWNVNVRSILLSSFRISGADPGLRDYNLGFRCVLVVSGS